MSTKEWDQKWGESTKGTGQSSHQVIRVSFCVRPCYHVKKKTLPQPSLNIFHSLWISAKWETTSMSHFRQLKHKEIIVSGRTALKRTPYTFVLSTRFFFFPFPHLWTWTAVPLKISSFCSVFIDARRDKAGCSLRTAIQRKRGKKHKRKGMKVAGNMRFNGRAIPSKLAASRQEFDAVLVDCQTRKYEEMKSETRELDGERTQIDEERWREEENVTSTSLFTSSLFLPHWIIYCHPLFQASFLLDFRSLCLHPSLLHQPSVCSKSVPGATLLQYTQYSCSLQCLSCIPRGTLCMHA